MIGKFLYNSIKETCKSDHKAVFSNFEFETSIKNENDKDNLDLLYSLIDQKKFALKNVKFTKYNVDYRSTNVSYIPFLRIDYSDKGEKKVAILDYISRSIIY